MRIKLYVQIIDSIMYEMLCTESDIVFAVGLLRRFLSNSGLQYQYAIKRVLQYIKGTMNHRLYYQDEVMELRNYLDAD